jgi:hypothetical protein
MFDYKYPYSLYRYCLGKHMISITSHKLIQSHAASDVNAVSLFFGVIYGTKGRGSNTWHDVGGRSNRHISTIIVPITYPGFWCTPTIVATKLHKLQ